MDEWIVPAIAYGISAIIVLWNYITDERLPPAPPLAPALNGEPLERL